MAQQQDANYNKAATGGLEGLALGAPIGGGSSHTGGAIGSGIIGSNNTPGFENDRSQSGANVGSGAYGAGVGSLTGTGTGTTGHSHEIAPGSGSAVGAAHGGGVGAGQQTGNLLDKDAAVLAGMGAGHADQHTGVGSGLATGAGVGAGAAAIGGASAAGGAGPGKEHLREELEMHKDGQGIHDPHHAESKGPHGLVFDEASGKYLHRRELDGKGSTGVPLQ